MATNRKITFVNDYFYHIYNRGVERRPTFIKKREVGRALLTLKYYRFANLPLKLSKFLILSEAERNKLQSQISESRKLVEIIAYCLMPNHFHFLLKQLQDNGISRFISDFTNSYTKYFNTKNDRVGPLFQGTFKAVIVETDEQLLHLSRYIHLNPVVSAIIKDEEFEEYQASSYPEYLNNSLESICKKEEILNFFSSMEEYQKFVRDQIGYAKELEKIKHLTLE